MDGPSTAPGDPAEAFEACSAWVRHARVQEDHGLAGEWVDFDHVFTFVDRGSAEFVFDGGRVQAEAGTALIMPPGLRHVVRSQPGRLLVQHIVHFDLFHEAGRAQLRRVGTTPGSLPREPGPFAGRLPVAKLSRADADGCRARFAELKLAYAGRGPHHVLRTKACLLDLIALVLEHGSSDPVTPPTRPSRPWQALDRAVAVIRARFDDPGLDVGAIARAAKLSPGYLPELFRAHLGVSVRRYLLHVRTQRARDLLAGGMAVGEVAATTGFASLQAFSRAFSRVMGVPPSAVPQAPRADPRPG